MSNNNKSNKNQKHRGENRSGVTTQIRLYFLKKDKEDNTNETSDAKISVFFDELKKGAEDNLIKIEGLFIEKLELEAEQIFQRPLTKEILILLKAFHQMLSSQPILPLEVGVFEADQV